MPEYHTFQQVYRKSLNFYLFNEEHYNHVDVHKRLEIFLQSSRLGPILHKEHPLGLDSLCKLGSRLLQTNHSVKFDININPSAINMFFELLVRTN